MLKYVRPGASFDPEEYVVVQFYVEPAPGVSLERALEALAGESSIDTWTDVHTLKKDIFERLAPKVFRIEKLNAGARAWVAYHQDCFEPGSVPQILSSIAGNIFGMKIVSNLRLECARFPEDFVRSFPGPALGVRGVRRYLKVFDRPLVGTIVKPKVGLPPKEWAQVAYEAWSGGLDLVKDDENLTSQPFCRFEDRLAAVLEKVDLIKEEQGRNVIYASNVTASAREMERRAELVKDMGGNCIMVDIIAAGFAALQMIREMNLRLPIHAHRAMHAAFTRNKKHGIHMFFIAEITRLAGADHLHSGTAIGKMEGPVIEVQRIIKVMQEGFASEDWYGQENWYGLKPMFAACSGGLHPGHVPKLLELYGRNIIIQAGGGVHGHPKGTFYGAKAMRQAVDAAVKGVDLEEYAREHEELRLALEKWGVYKEHGSTHHED